MKHTSIALGIVLIASTCAYAQDWPDPVALDVVPYETAGLTHGPCLGRPEPTRMTVWVRTKQPTAFQVVYDTRPRLDDNSPAVNGETTAADNTGYVTLSGLQPNSRYWYGIRIDGRLADLRVDFHDRWPTFRTLPDTTACADAENNPEGLFNFAFSVGHCASQDPFRSGGHYASPPAFDTLCSQFGDALAFHLLNGDVIYEELRNGAMAGIRANYRLYWQRGRSWARLMRNVPMLFTYDDHEIGWDIHGCGEVGLGAGRWLIRDPGVAVWDEYCGWASYPQVHRGRVRFGQATLTADSPLLRDAQADFSTLDLKTVSTLHVGPFTVGGGNNKPTAPNAGVYQVKRVVDAHTLELDRPATKTGQARYSIGTHFYYDWRVGNCHFFALDTRGERTRPNFADYRDPTRSILGAAQRQWLIDGITNTDARFIFIVCPDPFVIYHTAYHVDKARGGVPKGDGFSSFMHERDQLIDVLDALDRPVVILTGDVHAAAAVKVTDNVWEMMCGPLASTNHPLGTCGGGTMPLGGDWTSQGHPVQIKWIGAFPDNVKYERQRQPYFGVVQVNNVLRSPKPTGVGYQWVAYDTPQVVVRFHDGYTGRLVYAEGIAGRPD